MGFLSRKTEMPTAATALRGRPQAMPIPDKHFVLGNPIAPPFPDGLELALFGMGCFWGAERKFWQAPGVYTTAVGYAAGLTPNPLYEEVCTGRTGHNEVVRVVFDPAVTSYGEMLRIFWENHDPTQGMRQGNDVGTQYRSGIYVYGEEQRAVRERVARRLRRAAREVGLRRDHDRDRRCARVLLRRGLSPAVPRQEPAWVLRDRRNGCRVPDRGGRLGGHDRWRA